MKTATLIVSTSLIAALYALPASAAVDCSKDWSKVSQGAADVDMGLSAEIKDGLTGFDANGDGRVSQAEYMDVCSNKPEEYESNLNKSYFKKLKLRAG